MDTPRTRVVGEHKLVDFAVVESRSRLAARCVSFYQIVCLSIVPRVLYPQVEMFTWT